MKIVDTATDLPGVCALSGTSQGPFLQLDRPLGPEVAQGGTAYVATAFLTHLARSIGFVEASEQAAVDERIAGLERERDEAQDAHHELLQAVGTTLKHGAVVRNGTVELRKPYDRRQGKRKRG